MIKIRVLCFDHLLWPVSNRARSRGLETGDSLGNMSKEMVEQVVQCTFVGQVEQLDQLDQLDQENEFCFLIKLGFWR